MGMSASQARLIALTARMNDIEYQGQQINQQRTTLSNQVNALYNQLLEMSVPTPPSTSDYTKVQYSGISNASTFTLGNVTPKGKNQAGKDTYNIEFSYKKSGHSVAKNKNTATLTNTQQYLRYSNSSAIQTLQQWGVLSTETVSPVDKSQAITSFDSSKAKDSSYTGQDIYIAVSLTDYKNFAKTNTSVKAYSENGKEYSELPTDDNATVYVKANVGDLNPADTNSKYSSLLKTKGGEDEDKNNWTNVYKAGAEQDYEKINNVTDALVKSMNLYYVANDDKSSRPQQITTAADLLKYLDSTSDRAKIVVRDDSGDKDYTNPAYKDGSSSQYSVGDMPVMDLENAAKQLGDSYSSYITALRNAFPEEFTSTTSDASVASKFYVYIEQSSSGTNIPHFIKKSDVAGDVTDTKSISTYEYDEDGTYTQVDKKDDCQLEFDASTGRITKVGIPDGKGQISWIDVKAETVTDQTAYDEAFNDYEYQKNVYDKKQQEINAKTSIVQQQDKNLELKLTRLDNERNAVNTEIEAVKKVVSDNIEKSYKTFSG